MKQPKKKLTIGSWLTRHECVVVVKGAWNHLSCCKKIIYHSVGHDAVEQVFHH